MSGLQTAERAADTSEFGVHSKMASPAAPGAPRKLAARERPDIMALMAEVEAATPPHVVGSAWVCSLWDMHPRPIDDVCARMAALLAEGAYELASRVVDARLLTEEHWATLLQWAVGYTEGGALEPREHSERVLRVVFGGATTLAIVAMACACVRVTTETKSKKNSQRTEAFALTRPSELALLPPAYFLMAGGAGQVLETDGVERLHTEFGFPRDARTSRILHILAEHAFFFAPLSNDELHALRSELFKPTDDSGMPTFSCGPMS